jgi:predicted nucleic acid-binding Zn ribbon protein
VSEQQPGQGQPAQSGQPSGEKRGPELARAALDAARAKRMERAPRRRTSSSEEGFEADGARRYRPRGYSGPGPDPRDPAKIGDVLANLMKKRGWEKPKAEATVFGSWEHVVGPDIAAHSRPVKLEAGELTVEAESTAWATQLRLLAGTILSRIAAVVGHNVVLRVRVHGPTAPSWTHGRKRVKGPGPGDTYG